MGRRGCDKVLRKNAGLGQDCAFVYSMGACTSCTSVAVLIARRSFAHVPLWNAPGGLEGNEGDGIREVSRKYHVGILDGAVMRLHGRSAQVSNVNGNGNGNGNGQAHLPSRAEQR